MRLVLFRHGIAQDRAAPDAPPDPERALTPAGIERTRAAARGLVTLAVAPDLIFTSPYTRAVETARLAAEVLGYPIGRIRDTPALLPEADPEELFALLAREHASEVLCAGHAPGIDRLLAHAVAGGGASPFSELKKAGAARIDLHSPGRPGGVLVWLATAKVLRALARAR